MRTPDARRRHFRIFGPDIDADVDDELRFHLDQRAAELEARGLSPVDARTEALRRFGDVGRVRETCRTIESARLRRMSRLQAVTDVGQDVRFAARTLLRQPLFTFAAVLTLALGIGVNAAIFSAVNAYLFKPLPVRDPEQLVVIASAYAGSDRPSNLGYLDFVDVRERKDLFEDVVAWNNIIVSVRAEGQGDGELGLLCVASGTYFSMLGVQAQVGRLFQESDAEQRQPVLVISDQMWERRFRRDPKVVGQTVRLNGNLFTVIGVLPSDYHGTQSLVDPPMYAPLSLYPALDPGTAGWFEHRTRGTVRVMGRLKQRISAQQARVALVPLANELAARFPTEIGKMRFVVEPELRTRPDIQVSGIMPWVASIFLALVGLALLVACANVTNLLLARAAARSTEIAVRRTLGATGARLIRQLLTESLLLAAAAFVLGLLLARWSVSWINSLRLAVDPPVHFAVEIDWRVFAYATIVALTAGVLSGLAPAFRGARLALSEHLKEGGRGGSAGRARSRLRNTLVVAQVSISLVLLICAALFTRGVAAAARVDVGFRTDSLFMLSVDVGTLRYSEQRGRELYAALLERTRALPGVQSVALARDVPLAGGTHGADVFIEERPIGMDDGHAVIASNIVTPGYFATMGYRLLIGREFVRQDTDSSPPVIVVNEAMAARLWPGESALGRRVRLLKDGPPLQVVGVVSNGKWNFLNETPLPMLYRPLAQRYSAPVTLHVASALPASALIASLRAIIRDFDPELVPYGMRTMQEHLNNGLAIFFVRIAATLAIAIGVLGLVQTVVGLYGVIAYSVSQRTHEFGIRMALGARAGDVTRSVLRQGALLIAAGVAVGLVLALGITRLLSSVLVGVSATDARAFAGASGVLIVLALVSCYVPARRAARMEPVTALRSEG